jgi:CheY-like chemotaxis protein
MPEACAVSLAGLTILAVDDEPQFRAYFEELLSEAGARVVCCQNGVQALGRYQRDGESFDLIISDQSMPGMSGMEMVEHLRGLGSATPVILCSGYGYAVDETLVHELQIEELLHKPISRGELLAAIQSALSV